MNSIGKILTFVSILLIFSLVSHAQVTTSAIAGIVVNEIGEVVPGVTVSAIHTPSGTVYATVSNNGGFFTIQGMRSGGPYDITVAVTGYKTVLYKNVYLTLSDTFNCNTVIEPITETLEAATIEVKATKFRMERNGAGSNISSAEITELPTIDRSITDIVKLSPYANGMNIAGGSGRSANFTVDGANFNNNFGLSSALPGGGNPISMDAIQEVQVVVAPFDVRQTNFIGGGVNAITKSGTNKYRASAYTYHYNDQMRGNRINGTSLQVGDENDKHVYGFTVGGPIIKNKLFFFANFEYTQNPSTINQWQTSENGEGDVSTYTSRTLASDMEKVSDFLKKKYGYDAGSFTNFGGDQTNIKALARIDWNITDRHRLAVRYNFTQNRVWSATNETSSNAGVAAGAARFSQYSMSFYNSCYNTDNLVHSATVDLNSRIGSNMNNQVLASYSYLGDVRATPSSLFPFIDILDGTYDQGTVMPYISVGHELFSYNNAVNNHVFNIKDDFTIDIQRHHILAGASYEYQMANNSYMRNGTGYYRYKSLEDFFSGATPETVALTYGYNGNKTPNSQVSFNQIGLYAQDEWKATESFKLDYGIRFDILFFNNKDIMTNNAILALDYGGRHIDTGVWPKPQLMTSPRVGFTWDILGDKSLKMRGGLGLFTGRLPLVFFTNMPGNSNIVQNVASITTNKKKEADPLLENFKGDVITDSEALRDKLHALDPERFPVNMDSEKGAVGSEVAAVDPDFRMPMVFKTSLALDYQFPTSFPMGLTVEGTFNKTIYGVMLSNWNINSDTSTWERMPGADNRLIYPDSYKYQKQDAYVLVNTNKGYGYTANVCYNIRPINNLSFNISYTHTESREVSGMPGSNAKSAYRKLYTVDGPEFAGLQRSYYVVPDRVIASLSWTCRSKREGFDTHFTLMYEGFTANGNSFVYANDVNGDGEAYDLIYIPNSPDELQFASDDDKQKFWNFVNQDSYLSTHKGQYAEAYAARAPWVHHFDFKFAQDFSIRCQNSIHKLQLTADILNIGNLFNSKWGVPQVLDCNEGKILQCTNADKISATVAPVYKFSAGSDHTYNYSGLLSNCWQLQIGIRYLFN